MISEYDRKRIEKYCKQNSGDKIKPIANLIKLEGINFHQFKIDIENCLLAQNIILNHLKNEKSPSEILKYFGIPLSIEKWVSILQKNKFEDLIMRVDFLIDENGNPKICEFNIDSSVGGGEISALTKIYHKTSNYQNQLPFDTLAVLFEKLVRIHNCNQICILDWSSWETYGVFDFKNLITTLEYHLPGIMIFQCNEKSTQLITKETLVYRVFQLQDCIDKLSIFDEITDKAGHIVFDFSGEILSNKLWMALLQNEEFHDLLTLEIHDSIKRVIPKTVELNNKNFDYAIENKKKYFFKKKLDFGGHGVIPGDLIPLTKESTSAILCNFDDWIIQEKIVSKKYEINSLEGEVIMANAVFGLYKIGDLWSGTMVRASAANEIVNVAQGAFIGWGDI